MSSPEQKLLDDLWYCRLLTRTTQAGANTAVAAGEHMIKFFFAHQEMIERLVKAELEKTKTP